MTFTKEEYKDNQKKLFKPLSSPKQSDTIPKQSDSIPKQSDTAPPPKQAAPQSQYLPKEACLIQPGAPWDKEARPPFSMLPSTRAVLNRMPVAPPTIAPVQGQVPTTSSRSFAQQSLGAAYHA